MQHHETFKNIVFHGFLEGFGGPRGSQNAPKSLQNRFRRPLGASWGSLGALLASLGASWAALGAFLKRSWRLFGPSCGLLGSSWVLLDRSWRLLGSSWALLGRSWGAPGVHFGFRGGSFWSFVGLFLKLPCKLVKVSKNVVFSMFFKGFGGPRGSQDAPTSLRNRSRRLLGASWGSLGALLGLSWGSLAPLGQLLAPLGPPPEGSGWF